MHAGCGGARLPQYFGEVEEVRLDANPAEKPDIVASLVDLGDIGPFDAVYTSHCLEHLYPHEVKKALKEFLRVTRGFAMIIVPDLEGLQFSDEVLYESPAGPICAADLFYGHQAQIEANPHMAHHTGFTGEGLKKALLEAGFKQVKLIRDCYSVMAIATLKEF